MKNPIFVLWLVVAALMTFVLARLIDNAYFYFAPETLFDISVNRLDCVAFWGVNGVFRMEI